MAPIILLHIYVYGGQECWSRPQLNLEEKKID